MDGGLSEANAEISRLRALLAEARESINFFQPYYEGMCDCFSCLLLARIDAELSPEGKGGEDGTSHI